MPTYAKVRQSDRQPVFFVPRPILVFISLLIVVHLLRTFLSPDFDRFVIVMFGILPGRYMPGVISSYPWGLWAAFPSFITYAFLHADYTHLAINSAWLLAFGTAVIRKIGTTRFIALYLICAIFAALVHVAVNAASLTPMIGASGAISGMMGAAFRISLPDLMGGRVEDIGPEGRRPVRLLPLYDRQFLLMSGSWLVVNIIFGLTGIRVAEHVLMIAWDAHIAGFVAGALLIGLLVKNINVSGITDD